MNELYYGTPELPDLDDIDYMIGDGIPLQAKASDVSSAITFDDEALVEALKRIYSHEFHPMTNIEEHLFDETLRIMLQATDEGMAESGATIDKEFRTLIDWNTARWSAFKVHRMQNDIAAQLYDEDGTLKPFDRWAKDVEPMLDHHVGHWLRTEYNTAVTRTHQAADWKRFEENADIMPNLTWLPSTSAQPGADHKIYWGVTLPIDHPFWNSHRPGDRWGCKCSLENTDDEPTAIPDDTDPKRNQPADGLDTNPGKDGKLFSDSHPYIKTATREAKKAVEKYMEERVNLPKPIKVKMETEDKEDLKQQRLIIRKWAADNLLNQSVDVEKLNAPVEFTMKGIKEALNQPHKNIIKKNEAIIDIVNLLKHGEHKLSKLDDKDNPMVNAYHYIKIEIEGITSYAVVREMVNGKLVFYSIVEKLRKEKDD